MTEPSSSAATPIDSGALPSEPDQLVALYRHLFEHLRDAAFLADARTGLIIDANAVAATLVGRPRSELIGLHQAELHPKEPKDDYRERFSARVGGLLGERPAEVVHADGTRVPVSITASVFDFGGRALVLGIFRDLRETRRAEQAALSETAFRNAIEDSVLAGVLSVDNDGRLTYVSPAFCRMVGWAREELLGRSAPYPFWPPESRDGLSMLLQRVLSGRSHARSLETRLVRKDGSRFDCYLQVSELRIGITRIGWLAAIQDISATKQIQEAFGYAVAASRDGFLLVQAPTGRILDVNQAYCRMSGYSRDELLQMSVTDVDADESATAYQIRLKRFREEGGGSFAVRHRRRDGSVFHLEASVTFDRSRELLFSFVRDITDRLRAEAELRESEERYRMLFETMSQGVTRHAPDGSMLAANPAALRFFNRSFDDLARTPVLEIGEWLNPDGTPADMQHAPGIQALQTGQPVLKRLVGYRAAGTNAIKWLEVSALPQFAGASIMPSQVYITFDDVTSRIEAERERQRIEEQLHQAQRLESLGVIAGGIAHDFNNLLTGIMGNLSFARVGVPAGPMADSLADAEQACARAVGLTGQLLTFAKGGVPVKKTVDLGPLLEETVRFCLMGSSVALDLRLERGWAFVEVDPGQVAQVFQNIVINAKQAMGGAGKLTVTARRVSLAEGGFVRVSFADSGVGIAPSHLSRIFEPYFTTKGGGSGLGLAVAHSIVQKHGGRISVVSEVGRGTTFEVDLPASAGPTVGLPERPAMGARAAKARVLVMDDEPLVAGALSRMLKAEGHEVTVSTDGSEAVARYEAALRDGRRFDLVIMDLTIPGGMGGIETLPLILAVDPGARIVVSSGYSDDPVMADYRAHGFVACLGKPYRRSDLTELLAQLLPHEGQG